MLLTKNYALFHDILTVAAFLLFAHHNCNRQQIGYGGSPLSADLNQSYELALKSAFKVYSTVRSRLIRSLICGFAQAICGRLL